MSALFPSLFEEVLFWVVFFGGWVAFVLISLKFSGHRLPIKKKGPEPILMIPLFFLFMFVIPISVGYLRIGVFPSYLFYPGLAMWIVGWAIWGCGVYSLGRFHAGYVRVISDHKVIRTGPYRYVRHPLYASEILGYTGLGLALQSWVALIVMLITASLFYSNRIRIEERFLAAELGDEYVQYMKQVKRIIPHIL